MNETILKDTVCIVFDLETTGLYASCGDKVCEISALKVKGEQILGEFNSLVNPQRPISREAFMVHGITDEEVSKALPLDKIFPDFLEFIGGDILAAYNASFDMSFLNAFLAKYDRLPLHNEVIDILTLARRLLPGLGRYNLDSVAAAIEIPVSLRHRAAIDTEIAYKVFLHLIKLMEKNKIFTIKDVLKFAGRRRYHA